MNIKKTLLIASLGLVASLNAQETPATENTQPAANVEQTAPEVAPATSTETAAAPVAEAAESSTAPAEQAIANNSPVETQTADSVENASVNEAQKPEVATATESSATVDSSVTAEPATTASADEKAVEKVPENTNVSEVVASTDTTTAPTDSVTAEKPVEVANVAEPKAEKATNKSPLDILHSNTYNTVSNEAAGSTIGGNLAAPRKMHGIKALYVEPINERAAISFGKTTTYFAAFDNSQELGILTAGMAFEKFGFSIDGSFGKQWADVELADGTEANATNTNAGSAVGATASILLGSVDLVLRGHYVKPENESYSKFTDMETEQDIWETTGKLAASYSGETVFWTAAVDFLRHSSEISAKATTKEVKDGEMSIVSTKISQTDTSSKIGITPKFNIGAAVLQAEDAKVYLGANTRFPISIYDEIENVSDSHIKFEAFVTPNVFGEVMLSQYFMVFGGASFDWNVFSIEKKELGGTTETSRNTISNKTTVNLGSRVQYSRLAVELSFTQQFLQNPFGSFSTTDQIAVDLGVFINF